MSFTPLLLATFDLNVIQLHISLCLFENDLFNFFVEKNLSKVYLKYICTLKKWNKKIKKIWGKKKEEILESYILQGHKNWPPRSSPRITTMIIQTTYI